MGAVMYSAEIGWDAWKVCESADLPTPSGFCIEWQEAKILEMYGILLSRYETLALLGAYRLLYLSHIECTWNQLVIHKVLECECS